MLVDCLIALLNLLAWCCCVLCLSCCVCFVVCCVLCVLFCLVALMRLCCWFACCLCAGWVGSVGCLFDWLRLFVLCVACLDLSCL